MTRIVGISFEPRVPQAFFGAKASDFIDALARKLGQWAGAVSYIRIADPVVFPQDDRRDGLLSSRVLASFLAGRLRDVGIVQTVPAAYDEPFHAAMSVSVLDRATHGKAGISVSALATGTIDRAFGLSPGLPAQDIVRDEERAEFIEVLRALWTGWTADAIVRDRASHRYIDRNRVRQSDYRGRYFSIDGPTTTPRPVQGLPPVFVDVDTDGSGNARSLAAADVILLRHRDAKATAALVRAVDDALAPSGGRRDRAIVASVDLAVLTGAEHIDLEAIKAVLDAENGLGELASLGVDRVELALSVDRLLASEGPAHAPRSDAAATLRRRLDLSAVPGSPARSDRTSPEEIKA